jgi:hypothetical protein
MTASQQLTTMTMKNIPCMPGAVHTWLLEKNGYRKPAQTRRAWMAKIITSDEAA